MKTGATISLALGLVLAAFLIGVIGERLAWYPSVWTRPAEEPPLDSSLTMGQGYWRLGRPDRTATDDGLTAEERTRLLSIPYLQGSKPGRAVSGVTLHDRDAAYGGLNLVVSGHGTSASLIDMDGREIHHWALNFERIRYRLPPPPPRIFWRRARLLDNGDLLAIFEYGGLVRIDADSRVKWVLPARAHHDLDVDAEGKIYVLTQHNRLDPQTTERRVLADDRITVLNAEGQVLADYSIYDCLARSPYSRLLDYTAEQGDIFHTNTIEVLDGSQEFRSPLYRKGNLLVSLRELNAIVIVDPDAQQVVWALMGLWRRQHEPILLENGHMLVFDNYAGEEQSRVVEFDPFDQQIFWEYHGSAEQPFYSDIGGSQQRLPNGNTLIIETVFGRAFEVTSSGEIVWEYVNPHRAGDEGELIGALFDVVRLPPNSPLTAFVRKN